MQFPRYLGRVWTFAFRRFALRTDAMQILAASLVPMIAPYLGVQNPSQANSEVLAYIGMAILALVVIRLLSAPYFIWREDQAEIRELRHELDAPDRREMEAGLDHRIALRRELAEKLAKLISVAQMSQTPEMLEMAYGHRKNELGETTARISEIITALSYDVALRVTCLNLEQLCWKIIQKAGQKEDISADLTRLWAQRKLTFRLLHRDDEVNDMVTMIEIENLIEGYGESFRDTSPIPEEIRGDISDADDVLADVRRLIRKLGPNARLLGRQPNLTSPNRDKAFNQKDRRKFPAR
jgi:hypothetical protein